MKKVVLIIISALIFGIVLTNCSSKTASDDYEKLEGTTWVAETESVVLTLRFLDESVCTFGAIRKDDTNSDNLTTFRWRYQSIHDSVWALFHMYPMNEEGHYHGTVDNKKLFLTIYEDEIKVLCFERKQ